MKTSFIKAIRPQSVSLIFSVWLLMGSQLAMAQQSRNGYPSITKLCPGRGSTIYYVGRAELRRVDQPRPEGRQLTLYLVAQGEPLSSGIVVGSAKEVVTYQVTYPPGDKNYREPTQPVGSIARFPFSIPANLPANLLNRPVQLRFGDPRPGSIYTGIAPSYTIDPANCP
jgi:hypothetical protein